MGLNIGKIIADAGAGLIDSLNNVADKWIDTKAKKAEREIAIKQIVDDFNAKILEANQADEKELTERLRIDATGTTLSKNIRPYVMVFLCVAITGLCILDSCNISFSIEPSWVELYKTAWLGVLSFYFIGRSVEKIKGAS